MKNATPCAKKLTALLKKLPSAEPPEFPDPDDPIAVCVQSFLIAESTTAKALVAYRRLLDHIVDFNDLRVTMPHEVATYIGSRYPRAEERCRRMRAVLRNIYLREHDVTLEPLRSAGKRDIKKYLESLEGMSPYVASRVMLLSFDTHAIPVCEHLLARLVSAGAADADADIAEVAAWLPRQIKASEGTATHFAFQAWVDEGGGREKTPRRSKRTSKKATSRTTASSGGSGKSATKPRTTKRAGSGAG